MITYAAQVRYLSLLSLLAIVPSVFAQDDDALPTLKLDRIMASPAFAGQTRAPAAARSEYSVDTVASGLSAPWALAFLPDGDILVSENTGALRIVAGDGTVSRPLEGLPELSTRGWSGLFDVALAPDFADNRLVYFSYAAPGPTKDAGGVARVARARLNREDHRLDDLEVVLDGVVWQELHFGPDGKLYAAGAGDVWNDDAQDLSITFGKLLRLNPDGSSPEDNPWTDDDSVAAGLYSYGHRDIAGIATNPATGEIWISEHGPRGGDELNLIRRGANYGWAVVSYGTDYNGDAIGDGRTVADGIQQPRYFWRPSIAPSGLLFYSGSMFPDWQGNAFVTALAGQHISRLVLDGDRVAAEERLLVARGERIRELREGPDGALYALTNEASGEPKGTAELLRIYRDR